MKKATTKGVFRTLATRSVIAALPVAMVSAYACNMLVPTPPRIAAYEYEQVAEITVSPSTVGIAVSPLYGQTRADIDAQLDQMQALGVENIRVFVPWSLIEFNPVDAAHPSNDYIFQFLDEVMDAAAERNMGVLAEINSTPSWATADGQISYTGTGTPDPAAFAAFMQDFVAHTVDVNGVQTSYASIVSAYEIWNEPNAVLFSNPIDPAAYAALVKAAYQVIKPADPTATVVAGAVGHVINFGNFTMDPVDFLNAMIAADPDIRNYFDALSYHPYDESLAFSAGNLDPNVYGAWADDTAYNQVKDLMALIPGKKVWISEFGVPTYTYTDTQGVIHTVSQQTQRDYIADLLEHWDDPDFLAQAGPIFLYTGRDTATGSTNPDANYGLWTQDGTEKQVIYDYLRDWLAAHPQNPTDPTDPPDPIDPLAAALQAFVQQIAQAIANAVTQALVQTLGQQIANAIVNAIAQALASIGIQPPPPAAAPLSLRVASVESSDATTAAAEADSASATTESAQGEAKEADAAAAEDPKAAAAEGAAATPAAAEAAVTEPTVPAAEPVKATEPAAATETPAATEPTTTPASTESTTTEKPADTPAEKPAASDPKSDESDKKSDESNKKSDDPDKKSDGAEKDKKSEAKSGDSEAKSKGDGNNERHRKHGSGDELKVKVGAEGADGSSTDGGGES
ncbi:MULTISPECIES: cellulase family glycosylhydrolase [unclassified Mycobacterium]|uniref:cellulase family glycosylhydrolase n=1 Tax=unclassified Mycobacterium TaxID=2642494 RepID=UPI0029C67264|nr:MULTISPECIES: cellulase family glycosylhydrolase [unclassified Mycobacterium]